MPADAPDLHSKTKQNPLFGTLIAGVRTRRTNTPLINNIARESDLWRRSNQRFRLPFRLGQICNGLQFFSIASEQPDGTAEITLLPRC